MCDAIFARNTPEIATVHPTVNILRTITASWEWPAFLLHIFCWSAFKVSDGRQGKVDVPLFVVVLMFV